MRYLFVGAEGIEELSARIAESALAGRLFVEDHEEQLVLALRGATFDEARAFAEQGGATLADAAQLLSDLENAADVFALRSALLGLGALWHSELRLLHLLRRLSVHPQREVRAGVVAVASRVGYRLFLLELLCREEDPMLRRILRSATAFAEDAQT